MNKLMSIGSLGLAGLVATGLVVAGAPASTARGGDDAAVVRTVDDHGRHHEAGDDRGRHHGRHHRHHEAGDDHGRHHDRHHEAGDDRGHDDR